MVWAGYRAKLNHLILSVLDGVERNVPAFRVAGALVRLVWSSAAEYVKVCTRGEVPAGIVRWWGFASGPSVVWKNSPKYSWGDLGGRVVAFAKCIRRGRIHVGYLVCAKYRRNGGCLCECIVRTPVTLRLWSSQVGEHRSFGKLYISSHIFHCCRTWHGEVVVVGKIWCWLLWMWCVVECVGTD
jgi:hypothetical protein